MKLEIPEFKTIAERNKYLFDNKDMLITQKKSEIKEADGISVPVTIIKHVDTIKGDFNEPDKEEVMVKVVINTTNILDSHIDVHIPGLWKKSLKENKRIMHVQEHRSNQFDKIISKGEDLKASVKNYTWKELGFDADGTTQALIFDSNVKKSRNPYMFGLYNKNWVDNHSVGMRYIKVEFAMNDEDYEKEIDFWNKYISKIVNRKDAEDLGYFWVVTEANIIEGSAVPSGSNPVTPTLSVKQDKKTNRDIEAITKWLKVKDIEF